MIRAGLILAVLVLVPYGAQLQAEAPVGDDEGFTLTPELDLDNPEFDAPVELGNVEAVEQLKATAAEGAVLRGLDKVTGILTDMEMTNGDTSTLGRLTVTLGECRYPTGNPAGDAYAFLEIRTLGDESPVFEGWMIASSPALNALDNARYDVWVLRCITS